MVNERASTRGPLSRARTAVSVAASAFRRLRARRRLRLAKVELDRLAAAKRRGTAPAGKAGAPSTFVPLDRSDRL